MFCAECGAKNEDNAKFCVKCGAKLDNRSAGVKILAPSKSGNKMETEVLKKPRKKIKVVPIIILLLLAVVVVTFPRVILSGQSEKKLIEKFMKAEMSGDAEQIVEILPDEFIETGMRESGMTRKELIEELEKELNSVMSTVDSTYGEGWKYSYKIKSIKKASQEDIEDWENTYKNEYEMDVDISEGKISEIELNFSGKEINNTTTVDINLIKTKGKWCIDFASLASLL